MEWRCQLQRNLILRCDTLHQGPSYIVVLNDDDDDDDGDHGGNDDHGDDDHHHDEGDYDVDANFDDFEL